jgi:CheY-like chemotaxis protein
MARLLVVDDEVDILELVVRRLQPLGHEVRSADSAAAALASVERHGMPDAVVLDVSLAGADGFDLLEQLRERRPGLPALFLTVLWRGDVYDRIQAVGAGYAAKPFTVGQLQTAVATMLATAAPGAAEGRP